MAAPTIITLGKVQNTAAEQLDFGANSWTYSDEETNGALQVVVAAVAGVQHFLRGFILSFDAAIATKCTLTITDGSTVIATIQFATTAPTVNAITFPGPGLQATQGAALTIDVTGPGNIKATLCAIGMSSPDRGTYA